MKRSENVGFAAVIFTGLALLACTATDRGEGASDMGGAADETPDTLVEAVDTTGPGGEATEEPVDTAGGGAMSEAEERAESGIEGIATIGPTCPVQEVGEDCPDRPYETTLLIRDPTSGTVLERVKTDSMGGFRVALPPGTYVVESPERQLITDPQADPVRVTVVPERWARVTVRFDSGVR